MNHSRFLLVGAALCVSILLWGFLFSSWLGGPHRDLGGHGALAPGGGLAPGELAALAALAGLGSFPMFETGSPADVREVVQFCRNAGRGDVAGLRHVALRSPDPLVVGNALSALGRLGALVGDGELCALLGDPRIRVRQEAIVALGKSSDASVVVLLTPFLEQSDPKLRPLVIQALGRLDCAAARAALEGYASGATGATGATEQERAFLGAALSPPVSLRMKRTRVSEAGRKPVEENQ